MASGELDYYQILGVSRDADGATIKSAYRKLAMRYHPDRNPDDPECEARFKAINEAYDCLKDPQKRAAYDRYGHRAYTEGASAGGGASAHDGFSDISDIFESIFGSAFGSMGADRGAQRARRGADLRYDLEITLEEAFHGKSAEITIEVAQPCESCEGSGASDGARERRCNMCAGHGRVRAKQGFFMVERLCPSCHGRGTVIDQPCQACAGEGRVDRHTTIEVEIPPGVDTGTRIRLAGKGEAGPRGASAGDLYIFVHVAPHPVYQREGTTLATRVPISFTTAALGGKIAIPDLDGSTRELTIPAGIQSGHQLRIRGAGMPVLQGRGRGDLVVEIKVETPTRLSREQRELLEAFRASETGEECPESKSFFERLKSAFQKA